MQQMIIGALRAAEANLRRRIDLCREIKDEFNEAIGYQEFGRLLAYRDQRDAAEQALATALTMFEKQSNVQSQGIVWAYRALCALLMARGFKTSPPTPVLPVSAKRRDGWPQGEGSALSSARRALELADEFSKSNFPLERDYVRAHWLLSAAYRFNAANQPADLAQAEQHLTEALTRCRKINVVEHEADILLDLARLRALRAQSADQAQREEALRLVGEALLITERSGYVLQGADVHLFLAQMALHVGDQGQALDHARAARRLATCDGGEYTYKVAYDEAGALLKELSA